MSGTAVKSVYVRISFDTASVYICAEGMKHLSVYSVTAYASYNLRYRGVIQICRRIKKIYC